VNSWVSRLSPHKPTTAVIRLESDDARMHLSRTNGEMRGEGCAGAFGYISSSFEGNIKCLKGERVVSVR